MSADFVSYDDLVRDGWAINPDKGMVTRKFVSLSFCLRRDGMIVKCVQGYGATGDEALDDALMQANRWLRVEQAEKVEMATFERLRNRRRI